MNLEDWLNQPGGLADRLRTLRTQAGLSGKEFAEIAGWYPSRVSKLENGRQAPTAADVDTWTRACRASPADRDELLDLVSAAQQMHRDWRRRVNRGQIALQTEYNELVARTSRVRFFDTVWVPGLLQTPQYARFPLMETARLHGGDPEEVDAAVAVRMRRQQVLYDPGKQFEFVLWEPVLAALVGGCSPEVMLGQLDRLLVAMEMTNVRLGIVPLRVPTPTTPQNSFQIYDGTVVVETFVGESTAGPEDAARYARIMDMLWEEAAEGEAARRLIMQAVEDLRATMNA